MCPYVSGKVISLSKFFATRFAFIWPRSIMCLCVSVKASRCSKPFVTPWAHKKLLFWELIKWLIGRAGGCWFVLFLGSSLLRRRRLHYTVCVLPTTMATVKKITLMNYLCDIYFVNSTLCKFNILWQILRLFVHFEIVD